MPAQKTKWFEFEWNLDGKMKASKIDCKEGGDKIHMMEWPMGDHKLNYLMLTTGWNNQATAETYIING